MIFVVDEVVDGDMLGPKWDTTQYVQFDCLVSGLDGVAETLVFLLYPVAMTGEDIVRKFVWEWV